MRKPRWAAESLNNSSAMMQGMQFSRTTDFPTQLQPEGPRLERENRLLTYFSGHKEGAGIWKWTHYFDVYQRHFSKFVGREVHVLEVGIYSGGSLPMWKDYFGKSCHVYGVDIEEACTAYKGDQIEVFIGDQADRSFWARVRQAVPTVDILIDDGGHQFEQQRITLEEMLPHLRPGGIYLCEDIHRANNQFAAYLQGFASSLNAFTRSEVLSGVAGSAATASSFQQAIQAIHLYPFVAVIEKRDQYLREFLSPRHGTQWQPFL
jgi:SAM-dependent methyltransferase